MLPTISENSERESNPTPQLPYLFLSGSAFLVSFTDTNKQLFNVKSLFRFRNYGFSESEIYITFLGIQILFIKQWTLKFKFGHRQLSTKVGAKLLTDLGIFSIFSSGIRLYFHKSIRVVPLKYLMYFLAGINTK